MNVSNTSKVAAALIASVTAEASETASQTKAEAAKGDHQAIQKLARQQAQTASSPQVAQPVPQPVVESTSGKLNATA